jgi:hypothetical protein
MAIFTLRQAIIFEKEFIRRAMFWAGIIQTDLNPGAYIHSKLQVLPLLYRFNVNNSPIK